MTQKIWGNEWMHSFAQNKSHSLKENPWGIRDITCPHSPHLSDMYIQYMDTICRTFN